MQTNNGKKGGLLNGKPHSKGGIKAVVTDSNQMVELEGGEVIINKEASKKHWKELSRINQSAGGGVPILPPNESDADPDEYGKGGTITFNSNHIPSKWLYDYAKKIKDKYPKVWDVGGNIFGNEAFKNLERVLKRGYWTDSEEWMYKKWQSFNARHSGDIRIAGIIANLKWLNKVDKGWAYMKDLIEQEIAKKYPEKKAKGGVVTYKQKFNKKYGYGKDDSHTLSEVAKETGKSKKGLQQIYNKGIGAYKTNPESVRPNVKSKEQWAMARVYSAVMGGKASRVDKNELAMAKGGITLPPEGTLVSKDKKSKLDYKKIGNNYEFSVYDGEPNPVENYSRVQFKKRNGNKVIMTYDQFINYIYAEGFVDDRAKGGELANDSSLKVQFFTLNDPDDPNAIPNSVEQNLFGVYPISSQDDPVQVRFKNVVQGNNGKYYETIDVYYTSNEVVNYITNGLWKPYGEEQEPKEQKPKEKKSQQKQPKPSAPKPPKKKEQKPKKKKFDTSEALRKYLKTSNVQNISTDSPQSIAKEIAVQFSIIMEGHNQKVADAVKKELEKLTN